MFILISTSISVGINQKSKCLCQASKELHWTGLCTFSRANSLTGILHFKELAAAASPRPQDAAAKVCDDSFKTFRLGITAGDDGKTSAASPESPPQKKLPLWKSLIYVVTFCSASSLQLFHPPLANFKRRRKTLLQIFDWPNDPQRWPRWPSSAWWV